METTKAVSMDSVTEMLDHLQAVTLGACFCLNSVKLGKSSIQRCCETYWHHDHWDAAGVNELDFARVRSLTRFVKLTNDLEKQPDDQYILINLRERLRSISPFASSSRPSQHRSYRQSPSNGDFMLLDQRAITLTMIATLLKLCQILQSKHSNKTLCELIINDIQEHFVSPYSRILWHRAKRSLHP